MTTRRSLLGGSLAALVIAPAAAALLRPSLGDDDASLRALAASRGLIFGCATSTYELREADFARAFLRDCAMLVPEYELKRDLTEPAAGRTDFSAVDALLAFARQHGVLFRGHPLVWFDSNPPWLKGAVAAATNVWVFTQYIQAAVGRYRGHVHSWDVVNEAVEPKDGRADGLRESFWLKRFGPSYIDHAFLAARAADPDALLVYNDYGLEAGDAEHDARRRATLKLLEGLVARRVPIGALGLQGHLDAFGAQIDQRQFTAFLGDVRALGLRILITEHDVDDSGGPLDFTSRDQAVADTSRRFLDVALDNPATQALLTWGLSDRFLQPQGLRNTLLRNTLLRGTPRKLPLDGDLHPTPMRVAIARAIAGARRR
jgi:endo-1,4-beta-xylanase